MSLEDSPADAPENTGGAALNPKNSAFNYFEGSPEEKALGLFSIVGAEGSFSEEDVQRIPRELALRIYDGMLTVRVVDRRMMALQRQGRISFYGEALGQEAAVVGSAAALNAEDWLVPALREAGAGLYHGLPLAKYLAQIFGNAADVTKGRQMPCHPCDRDTNYVVMSSVVSTQIMHAVGIAMGMKLQGHSGRMCIGYMGDGGTSEPDFHTALNFAGVMQPPVVLVCQNNQWAISTPGSSQTASQTIAVKGLGYGVESLRADGNDALAVYEVTRYAAEKARRGDGPTFIELLTYRVSAHSSSDDPSRYRDESITLEWRERRDPLQRMLGFLTAQGWLDVAGAAAREVALEEKVRELIQAQEGVPMPSLESLFDDVFEAPTWLLDEQRESLLAEDRS
ncbi:MAG: 3-methyl-2-oxobutanoate dehydrogenase [Deltaproteobacteria bacterium CG_4_9_14_3_um_filter_63_12]|nr:MAG: 3-methyl-2-oxobutanoate dehydrogenase [Deltaproteobacteria bacterium CG17_big_fil_post_rev_8_21_14_2_50_63_7]PJB43038.1 MAG: 3-methyl-2-oxobutanoate dehydrogenase [Deltaproteobacteria bacterium CG_4_9_14_3_um_filter_63_12]